MPSILQMIELSQTEKKTLIFYIAGHEIAGVVRELIGTEAVVVYNRVHSKVVIRLDQILAVAMT